MYENKFKNNIINNKKCVLFKQATLKLFIMNIFVCLQKLNRQHGALGAGAGDGSCGADDDAGATATGASPSCPPAQNIQPEREGMGEEVHAEKPKVEQETHLFQ